MNTITDRQNNVVNKSLKEPSYIGYDDWDYVYSDILYIDVSSRSAIMFECSYAEQLFFKILKFAQGTNSTVIYSTINVNYSDIFEECSQGWFINFIQMNTQIIPTNDNAYF